MITKEEKLRLEKEADERIEQAERGLFAALEIAQDTLGMEWTCDLIEDFTRRKVVRNGTNI